MPRSKYGFAGSVIVLMMAALLCAGCGSLPSQQANDVPATPGTLMEQEIVDGFSMVKDQFPACYGSYDPASPACTTLSSTEQRLQEVVDRYRALRSIQPAALPSPRLSIFSPRLNASYTPRQFAELLDQQRVTDLAIFLNTQYGTGLPAW